MSKKRKLTRKERKAQRDAELQRRGIERRSPAPRAEIMSDIQPLVELVSDPSEGAAMLLDIVVGSDDLADEPELESIFVAPMQCVETFLKTAGKLGFTPDALDQMPEEEADDAQAEILSRVAKQLLTRELRTQIADGVDQLRLRLKQQGKLEETARVAAVQSFLDLNRSGSGWGMVGVVGEIMRRSLAIGWELVGAAVEADESGEDTVDLLSQIQRPEVVAKTEALIERTPGLRAYLEKEVDQIWENGADAVFSGELRLGLFSSDELDGWSDILAAALGLSDDDDSGGDGEEDEEIQITAETAPRVIEQVDTYLTNLFKGDRLAQLRSRLEALSQDSTLPPPHLAFIGLLAQALDHEDAVAGEMSFLMRAFFAELATHSAGRPTEDIGER